MLRRSRLFLSTSVLFLGLFLAGCEDSKERAERHFQSGVELLEAGDVDRAVVEFRNALKYDDSHKEARLAYAKAERERGDIQEAFSQYLRAVEYYPDSLEAHVALTRMSIEYHRWDIAERHNDFALKLAPDDPEVVFLNAALEYRYAMVANNAGAAEEPVAIANEVIERDQHDPLAWRIVIDDPLTRGDLPAALAEVNTALGFLPGRYELHTIKLRILNEMGDLDGVGDTLKVMTQQFPNDEDARNLLLTWYIEQEDIEGAETFLRQIADAPGATIGQKLIVVDFLRQTVGRAAATAEVERLIADDSTNVTYQAAQASILFEDGETDRAIAQMQDILNDRAASEETSNLRIILARMLMNAGNEADARAEVDKILTAEEGHVEALKMKAAWLIEDGQSSDAVVSLRRAQGQAPRDPEIMLLMGRAHERAGARELAGERYALAVELSGGAVEETLTYAAFLMADERLEATEAVLRDALNVAPGDVRLLAAMGDVQLQKRNWSLVEQIIEKLHSADTPASTQAANTIQSELLLAQNRLEDAMTFQRDLTVSTGALARLVQELVDDERYNAAISFLDERLKNAPGDPTMRFLLARVYGEADQFDEAEAIYRELLNEFPGADRPLQGLHRLLEEQGRDTEAQALIDDAIAAAPDAITPRLVKAARLEEEGDIEGAIAIYEGLYEQDDTNVIVANNLASLLATYHGDEDSLGRAAQIAQPLSGSEIPAFQDTYGWIEYRRGNYADALSYLKPASESLSDDAMVQYHLGMTYVALDRKRDARHAFTRVLEIAGDSDQPQFAEARRLLSELAEE
ncbi:tetratricopeptide repeat protein [Aliiroseovarius sp. YM-037]|uniref:tetratricopeptide repeat protein n=1 Tax=Aliiroseovarius sp. YM-037 TaxID=3341728 RepID=UPI003A806333